MSKHNQTDRERAELEAQLRAAGDSEEEIAEVLRGYDCHYWEDVLRREASAGEPK